METRLEIHKDKTLLEATEMARELMGLQKHVSIDRCRLVKYDEYQDSLEKSFEGEESTPISTLLGGVKASYTFDLLLETRRPEQMFLEYKPGGVTVKVYEVDIEKNIIHPPINVRAYHLQTVEEFKETLHKVFVECSGDVEDCSVAYNKSRLYRLLDQYRHTICITCNLPSNKSVKEYLQAVKVQKAKVQALSSSRAAAQAVSTVLESTSIGDGGAASLSQSFNTDDHIPHHLRSLAAGDEGLSENDSAFYSGATNSKHSLSGGEHGSNFSISSCSTPADAGRSNCAATAASVDSCSSSYTVTTTDSSCHSSVMASKPTASTVFADTDSRNAVAFDEDLRAEASQQEGGACSDSVRLPYPVSVWSADPVVSSGSQTWCDFPSVDVCTSATITTTTTTTSVWSPSSSEQLHVDLPALCARLTAVGGADFVRGALSSSHSDPSIYHTLAGGDGAEGGNDSDDSMRCRGSSGSHSVCSGLEDTSTEFNLSPSLAPDPDPMVSSPEDGYTFEEDNLHEAQAVMREQERSSAAGSSVDPELSQSQSLCNSSGQCANQLDSGSSSSRQGDGAIAGGGGGSVGVSDEDWWELDSQEQPQPFQSFLERTTSTNDVRSGVNSVATWDMDLSSVGGADPGDDQSTTPEVEGCDVNLSIKGRLRPVPPPPPPPPPPPLPLSANKLNLELNVSYKPGNSSDSQEVAGAAAEESDLDRYFHAVVSDGSDEDERTLQVSVDKRITLGAFKEQLEPFVGVTSNLFKVYRVYSNNQESESTRLSDTLSFFEDVKFNIKLGRALLTGEHRVKVFQLCVNEAEPCKYLVETIFAKGMTVLESKQILLDEIKAQCDMDIPLSRCRLRKKSWTNPCTVYLDTQVYDTDIVIYPNWEIFLEVLEGPEQFVESRQLAVYVRHWHPSTHVIDCFQELVLARRTVEELKRKISGTTGIPVEHVEIAKAKGTFPCEVSVLEVQTYLEWNPHASDLKDWPLYICDDGNIIFFRVSHQSHRVSFSPRKERALKIYTDDEPTKSSPEPARGSYRIII
ncbi:ubiquitin carboxyl-terminal hydrolase 47 [Elysia marginata]|uniref:Ubiquitin carboxyl-terminal hydrolase 47 n=1 Tax=Elysia marginata TaxID=1093978 RepID=A0AAV4F8H8_9GAST|nr:ubiquitin carboxyl-terminal hydrolase 47 [Elysia marginata]